MEEGAVHGVWPTSSVGDMDIHALKPEALMTSTDQGVVIVVKLAYVDDGYHPTTALDFTSSPHSTCWYM